MKTLNLNSAEITRMLRKGYDFTGTTIIQLRGSTRTCELSRARIIKSGATDFILLFDKDASMETYYANYNEPENVEYDNATEFNDFAKYGKLV